MFFHEEMCNNFESGIWTHALSYHILSLLRSTQSSQHMCHSLVHPHPLARRQWWSQDICYKNPKWYGEVIECCSQSLLRGFGEKLPLDSWKTRRNGESEPSFQSIKLLDSCTQKGEKCIAQNLMLISSNPSC